ncbi:MAG: AAA family ATPase [Bacteriovoracaceae bacterium]|nr:AAA family ATPase [Bacteriovoracaceae bacterium]
MSRASNWLYSFNSEASDVLQKSKNGKAKTIAVSSGKGGVGKTSIAIKFAKDLAARGKKVLLIDCDFNLSNTSIKLNIPLNNYFSEMLTQGRPFEDCLYRDGNFHLLPAANGDLEQFYKNLNMDEVIIDIINAHENSYDIIILDSPAGISRETLTLNAYCDHRFIIVTPDRSSITDSYSLMKVLSKNFGIKENHIIVNFFSNKKQYDKVVKTLSETAENFLGCRSYLIGGLRKYDISADAFDRYFLHVADSAAHKDFVKLSDSYVEKFLGRSLDVEPIPSSVAMRDVHLDVHY